MVIGIKRVVRESVLTFWYLGNWGLVSKQALGAIAKDSCWERKDWTSPRDCMVLSSWGCQMHFWLPLAISERNAIRCCFP